MLTVVSAFRNASARLDPWFAQLQALRTLTPVQPLAVVGDSTDDTETRIRTWASSRNYRNDWFRYDHGQSEYGSTEHPDRLRALSQLFNATLDELSRRITAEDTVVWVEGDTFWSPYLMLQLQRFLRKPEVDIVAPMTFAGEAHYDLWAMRTLDGQRFGPFWPYGRREDFTDPTPLVEMGSVGTCIAMTGHVAQTVRIQNGQAIVGWCEEARTRGFRVWCAKELRCDHPFQLSR